MKGGVNMAEFKVGDVVCLKSDLSRGFTVHALLKRLGKPIIELVYFDEKQNKFLYPKFAPELLTKTDISGDK